MGWHYFSNPRDVGTYFRESGPNEVFETVKRLRRNNGTFVSDVDIWRELWTYWCGKEPGRCGQEAVSPAPGQIAPREMTKEFWGPILWMAINLHAVRFEAIGKAGFLRFLGSVSTLMTCPECIAHWQNILATRPPGTANNTLEACIWANDVHNLVNASRGAPIYPYERMVLEYGAPTP